MASKHLGRVVLHLLVVVVTIAMVGAMTAGDVGATKRAPTKTTLSISKRVQIQTDNCENAGGEISVSYGYESDGSESATTSCSGGLLDGNVCINEETTIQCYQAGRVLPTGHPAGNIPLVPITDVQVVQPTPTPGVTVGAINDAPVVVSDGGSGQVPQAGDGSVLGNPVVEAGPALTEESPATSSVDAPMPLLVPLN